VKNTSRVILIIIPLSLIAVSAFYFPSSNRHEKQETQKESPITISDADSLRIMKEVLETENLDKTLATDNFFITDSLKKLIKYVYVDKETKARNPILVENLIKGHYVSADNEYLVVVRKDGLSHVEGFMQYHCAVYDTDLRNMISKIITFSNPRINIFKGSQTDYLLITSECGGQGLSYWNITYAHCTKDGRWIEKEFLEGACTDKSPDAVKTLKIQGIKDEDYPKVTNKEILFPDRKYVWDKAKESFLLIK